MDRATKAVVVTLCVVAMLAGIVELWAGWVAPSSRSYGELIDAPIWNQDVVSNTQHLYDTTLNATVTNGNAHDHVGGDGAAIVEDALSFTDNVTADATTSAHGLCPKGTNTGAAFLRDDLTWAASSGGGAPSQISGGYVSRASQALRYDPDQGNRVWLYESGAWAAHTIPAAGVTVNVSPTTLTPGAEGLACFAYVQDNDDDGAADTLNVTTTSVTTQDGITVIDCPEKFLVVARCGLSTLGAIEAYNDNRKGTSSPQYHYIWNYYNRRQLQLSVNLSGLGSHTYNTATWRAYIDTATSSCYFIAGNDEAFTGHGYGYVDKDGTAGESYLMLTLDAVDGDVTALYHDIINSRIGSGFTGSSGPLSAGLHYMGISEFVQAGTTTFGSGQVCVTGMW